MHEEVLQIQIKLLLKDKFDQGPSFLRLHYENMPIQIYRKFHLQILKIFR